MKPTEAKEWIDRLVEAGLKREDATGIVDKMVTATASFAGDITAQALRLIAHASEKQKPTEPEPPPVEIPRRVAVAFGPLWGKTGTVIEDPGDGKFLVEWDDENISISPTWTPAKTLIVLRLTKTERALLLLEKLSREAWAERGTELPRPSSYTAIWIVTVCGGVTPLSRRILPPEVPFFPTNEAAIAACNTILRAGLAWWEEGEQ